MSRTIFSVPRRDAYAPYVLFCSLFMCASIAFAQVSDTKLEERVKALSAELRCLVCQNQTVADSDAPVARDMRDQVRAQLAAGKSEAEVKTYMTERFGDFVLYRPPLRVGTVLLWIGPFLALLAGGWLMLRNLRQRRELASPTTELSESEREKARQLLAD